MKLNQIIIAGYVKSKEDIYLDNIKNILKEYINKYLVKEKIKTFKEGIWRFEEGFSLIVPLTTSHLYIETWPEFNFIYTSFSICTQRIDVNSYYLFLKDKLQLRKEKIEKISFNISNG